MLALHQEEEDCYRNHQMRALPQGEEDCYNIDQEKEQGIETIPFDQR